MRAKFGSWYNVDIVRGDTCAFALIARGIGQNANLEGAWFTVKSNFDDDDEHALFQKSLGDGIEPATIKDIGRSAPFTPADKVWRVRVAPGDTIRLDIGKYYYDFSFRVNGDVATALHGYFTIHPNITSKKIVGK